MFDYVKWETYIIITSSFGERSPTAFTMKFDVIGETLIFLFGPCALVCVLFFTARRSAHYRCTSITQEASEAIIIYIHIHKGIQVASTKKRNARESNINVRRESRYPIDSGPFGFVI